MEQFIQPTELAWASGLIDGEGHVGIVRSMKGKGNGPRATPYYWIRLEVEMCHEATVRRISAMFGSGGVKEVPGKTSRSKTSFVWRISASEVARVLRLCLPYLFTKKRLAELAIECHETPKTPGTKVTEEVAVRRDRIYSEYRSLMESGRPLKV